MHRTSAGSQKDGDAVGFTLAVVVRVSYSKRKIGKEIGKQRLNKLGMRSVWQTPPCSTHAEERCRDGFFTQDDFVVVGSLRALGPRIGKTLSGKYSMRESHPTWFWESL